MRSSTLPLVLLVLLAACGRDEPEPALKRLKPPTPATSQAPARRSPVGEPERVLVDHILIGVKSPRLAGARHATSEEAREVAYRLLDELRGGGDWKALKAEYSEDPPPGGPYGMANHMVAVQRGEFPRGGMAKAFGDVGFTLEVGAIGMADYDPATSPFGFHIIKRLR